jgi:hypothetical protein
MEWGYMALVTWMIFGMGRAARRWLMITAD